MDFSKMKDNLVSHREHAQRQIEFIRNHSSLTLEELHDHIYDYVLFKYNLFGDVQDVFSLDELAKLSVAKGIRQSKEKAIAFDNKSTCDGATSAMNKKVLLLMAIQKELNIKFPLNEVVMIKDTKLLAEAVLKQITESC